MSRSAWSLGAALLAIALASSADAQTAAPGASATPTLHARAHPKKRAKAEPEGRQITVHKSAKSTQQPTPTWLTLGAGAPVGTGNNYVTSTFDQPSPIEGTTQGWRGQERIIQRYGVPGTPLFTF
jgi:hypothetical protein